MVSKASKFRRAAARRSRKGTFGATSTEPDLELGTIAPGKEHESILTRGLLGPDSTEASEIEEADERRPPPVESGYGLADKLIHRGISAPVAVWLLFFLALFIFGYDNYADKLDTLAGVVWTLFKSAIAVIFGVGLLVVIKKVIKHLL